MATTASEAITPPVPAGERLWTALALLVAAVGVAGSLHLSLGLGLRACPLCFYQRTFVMSAAGVLMLGWLAQRGRPGFLCLLALPLVTGGLGVAAWHEYLVLTEKLECPPGLFDLGTAPAQSLAMFALLFVVTFIGAVTGRAALAPVALVLGGLMAWGCIASSPPMPPAKPPVPGEKFDMCRPVWKEAAAP
jgi:disulfide bond formation protein DsbB